MQTDGNISKNGNADLSDIERRVRLALEHVKPYLHVDGGSVELVRIDMEARVAEVCLLGACHDCSLASMTLRAGIERAVLHEVPELRRVEAVSRPEIEKLFHLKMN
jgi:Fe-S cluster biogenesis protein NfuA